MDSFGLIVNPIAGMGGPVGLKGTDGRDTLEKARELGAEPVSPDRARRCLEQCTPLVGEVALYTYPEPMGAGVARDVGFDPIIVGNLEGDRTSSEDTKRAVRDLQQEGVDLLVFAGGDGTARDIVDVLTDDTPVIGIPTGVKIHSSVYAVDPESAGELVETYHRAGARVEIEEREVMDIDEDAFREDEVRAKLYGYLNVPFERGLVQSAKSSSEGGESPEAIAHQIVDTMDEETLYIIGPGTTTRAITEMLELEYTLLGVDAVLGGELVGTDLREAQLIELLDEYNDQPAEIVVTAIGGQGHIFGRGNQQISPAVIRRVGEENVTVVCTEDKIGTLEGRPLLVDTGDPELDEALSGYRRIVSGYRRQIVYRVSA